MLDNTISAGELRNRITIERASVTRNSDGSEAKAWAPFTTANAKITTQGGREFFAAKTVSAELTHEIQIRYQPGIVPSMRARFDDPKTSTTRYFDIRAVLNSDNERRHLLLLHVRELVGRDAQS